MLSSRIFSLAGLGPIAALCAFALSASVQAAQRPKPGEPLKVTLHKVADAGSFDPNGEFAVALVDTERGYEAAFIKVPAKEGVRYMIYSVPMEKVVAARADPKAFETVAPCAPDAGRKTKPIESEITKDVPPSCVSGHRGIGLWTNPGFFPDSPLAKGVAYAARTTPEGVKLLVHCLKESQPREYGPIGDPQGEKMTKALALSVAVTGDAFVVGLAKDTLCVAQIEDVFADELMEMRLKAVQEHFQEEMKSALKAKSFSMTAVGPHLDRPYDAMAVLSDGRPYFGAMPHHPTRGSCIFTYDAAKDEMINLGDVDVLSNEKEPTDVPGMMHAPPVEANGTAFFVGQDPFYGKCDKFPELPVGAIYPGSHILGYDLKKGTWKDHGRATPIEGGLFGGRSVFWLAADAKREVLYARLGYHGGPVYRLDLKTGKFEENIFQCDSKDMLVAESGKVYFGKTTKTIPADPNKAGSRPQVTLGLARFDPDSKDVKVLVEDLSGIEWFKGQDGKKVAYGFQGSTIYSFDTSTETLKKEGEFKVKLDRGDAAFRNGVAYKLSIWTKTGNGGQGANRAVRLLTHNLASGETKDHGIIVDQDGRLAQELWAMDVGEDGTVYIAGSLFPKAGDAYSTRLKRHFLNDDRFLVIKGVKP